MTYSLDYFINRNIFKERPSSNLNVDFGDGSVIKNLPDKIRSVLFNGTSTHKGDYSRQDASVITALLRHGLSARDTYATFLSSPRGKHAAQRKNGHLQDYVQRTIRKAISYLGMTEGESIRIDFARRKPELEGEGVITVKASEVSVERPQWIWPKYIPAGRITLIAGNPGEGKSTLTLDIVSRISRGTFLPVGGRTVPGTCLVASAEDATADTIVPRLIALDARLDRVEIMKDVRIDDETVLLSFPRDLGIFREAIEKRGARLVVVDPLNAFLSREVDSHRDQDIRGVLAPFETIAEETGAAIVIVAHLNKREEASILYRIGGSIGLVGAARSVLGVSRIPDKDTRVLYSLKSNLGPKPPALEYELREIKKLRGETGKWKGEEKVVSNTVRWLGETDFDPSTGTVVSQDKAERAAETFLRQIIGDGEVKTEIIFKEARAAGVSRPQLVRVKEALEVQTFKKQGIWYWKFQD